MCTKNYDQMMYSSYMVLLCATDRWTDGWKYRPTDGLMGEQKK